MNVENNGQPQDSKNNRDKVSLTALALGEISDPAEVQRLAEMLKADAALQEEYDSTVRLAALIRDSVESDLPLAPGSLHDVVLAELSNVDQENTDQENTDQDRSTQSRGANYEDSDDETEGVLGNGKGDSQTVADEKQAQVTLSSSQSYSNQSTQKFLSQKHWTIAITLSLLVACAIFFANNWGQGGGRPDNVARVESAPSTESAADPNSTETSDLESDLLEEEQFQLKELKLKLEQSGADTAVRQRNEGNLLSESGILRRQKRMQLPGANFADSRASNLGMANGEKNAPKNDSFENGSALESFAGKDQKSGRVTGQSDGSEKDGSGREIGKGLGKEHSSDQSVAGSDPGKGMSDRQKTQIFRSSGVDQMEIRKSASKETPSKSALPKNKSAAQNSGFSGSGGGGFDIGSGGSARGGSARGGSAQGGNARGGEPAASAPGGAGGAGFGGGGGSNGGGRAIGGRGTGGRGTGGSQDARSGQGGQFSPGGKSLDAQNGNQQGRPPQSGIERQRFSNSESRALNGSGSRGMSADKTTGSPMNKPESEKKLAIAPGNSSSLKQYKSNLPQSPDSVRTAPSNDQESADRKQSTADSKSGDDQKAEGQVYGRDNQSRKKKKIVPGDESQPGGGNREEMGGARSRLTEKSRTGKQLEDQGLESKGLESKGLGDKNQETTPRYKAGKKAEAPNATNENGGTTGDRGGQSNGQSAKKSAADSKAKFFPNSENEKTQKAEPTEKSASAVPDKKPSTNGIAKPGSVEMQKKLAKDAEKDPLQKFDENDLPNESNERLSKMSAQSDEQNSARSDADEMPDEIEIIDPAIENRFIEPLGTDALSTFSADTDTASYTNIRRMLREGKRPHPEDVRIEEMVNYFDYQYGKPKPNERFSVTMEMASCPWSLGHKLLRVGLKAREYDNQSRPPSNIVLLIDVSGSMRSTKKLPLLKMGLHMMVDQLREDDYVSIVTYSNVIKTPLEPTDGSQKQKIKAVIDSLSAVGSTNGGEGLQTAYRLAEQHLLKNGSNRIVMGTDGDFNVGISDDLKLAEFLKEKAKSGVFLTVCGFGSDNFKDQKMQVMSQNGNGKVFYIDSLAEAKRVFADKLSGSLVTVAKDVKLQMLFNPRTVQAYRLIGYENRMLDAQDFNDDRKDAGEMDAGDRVTALYEIIPANSEFTLPTSASVDDKVDLKYQVLHKERFELTKVAESNDIAALRIRFKHPDQSDSEKSKLREFVVKNNDLKFNRASEDFKFASTVAGFGMLLRGSRFRGSLNFAGLKELGESALLDGRQRPKAETDVDGKQPRSASKKDSAKKGQEALLNGIEGYSTEESERQDSRLKERKELVELIDLAEKVYRRK